MTNHNNKLDYEKITYNKDEYIKKDGKVTFFAEKISGGRQISNFVAIFFLTTFGFGFFISGISSYFSYNIFPFYDYAKIEFLPQGILLLFYGTCSLLLCALIVALTFYDIGSGINSYDLENRVVRIFRKGFPKIEDLFSKDQEEIYVIYNFSQIVGLELSFIGGINPQRSLYLELIDGRSIPLTASNDFTDMKYLEEHAIFLSELLKMDLKLNIQQ